LTERSRPGGGLSTAVLHVEALVGLDVGVPELVERFEGLKVRLRSALDHCWAVAGRGSGPLA
jgi:hypothetical protein